MLIGYLKLKITVLNLLKCQMFLFEVRPFVVTWVSRAGERDGQPRADQRGGHLHRMVHPRVHP